MFHNTSSKPTHSSKVLKLERNFQSNICFQKISFRNVLIFHQSYVTTFETGRLLKAKEKTEASSVVREIDQGCCRRKCIGDIPVRYVTKKREEFWSKTIQE